MATKQDIIRLRCTEEYKENVKEQAKNRGFEDVSNYIRFLIHEDKLRRVDNNENN